MESAVLDIRALPVPSALAGGDPSVIVAPLEDHWREQLRAKYLAYRPRDSFQGLPPLRDDACLRWVEQMLAAGMHLVAISAQDTLLGHAALFPLHARACELLVVVWRENQNQGIGTALVESAIRLAAERGYQRVVLTVEATNVRARHVYEKCGFKYRGQACHGEARMVRRLGGDLKG